MATPAPDTANKIAAIANTGASISIAVPGGTAPWLTMTIVQDGDKPLDLTLGAAATWTLVWSGTTGTLASDARMYYFAVARSAITGAQVWTLANGVTGGKWAYSCMPWTNASGVPIPIVGMEVKTATPVTSWNLGSWTGVPAASAIHVIAGVSLGNQTGGASINLTGSLNTELTDVTGTIAFSTALETNWIALSLGGNGSAGTANIHVPGNTAAPVSARRISMGFYIPSTAPAATEVHSSGSWLVGDDEDVVASAVIIRPASFTLASGTPSSSTTALAITPPPPPPAGTVDSDGFVLASDPPVLLFAAEAVGAPFPVPPSFEATEAIYARLPQSWRDEDRQDVLRGYVSLVGDQQGEVGVLLDRLAGRFGVSHLADPVNADANWLPWLATVMGVPIEPGDTAATLRTKITNWSSQPLGTRAAVIAAVKPLLTGEQIVLVESHADGVPWRVNVHTRSTETANSTAVQTAAQNVAPAGVEIRWQAGVATWSDIHALYLTWADINGKTWSVIQDTKA